VAIRALPAPKNTIQGASDWALINNVVTWVLSPNSAKKIVMNVEANTRWKLALAFGGEAVGESGVDDGDAGNGRELVKDTGKTLRGHG